MTLTLDIPPDLLARVDALARRSGMTPSQVVADALHGRSLEWQERFIEKVSAGLAAADAGDFAAPGEVAQVLAKYRRS